MNVYQQAVILASQGFGSTDFSLYQKILKTPAVEIYIYIMTLEHILQQRKKQDEEDKVLEELNG
jgi:hypothetical protein